MADDKSEMTDREELETELDAYQDRVSKPLWRLFRAYASVRRARLLVTDGLYVNL